MKQPAKLMLSSHASRASAENAKRRSKFDQDDLVIVEVVCRESGKPAWELRLLYRKHHDQINGTPRKELQ